jgi:hypothetical protein
VPSEKDGDEPRENRASSLRRDGGPQEPEVTDPGCQEKPLSDEATAPVPQTDSGRWVENTKGIGRTLVKELGKMTP